MRGQIKPGRKQRLDSRLREEFILAQLAAEHEADMLKLRMMVDNALMNFVRSNEIQKLASEQFHRLESVHALLLHDFKNIGRSKEIDQLITVYHAMDKAGLL